MYSKYVLILITIAFSFNFSFEQTIKSYGKATGYVEIDESYDDVLEETIDRAITIAENKAELDAEKNGFRIIDVIEAYYYKSEFTFTKIRITVRLFIIYKIEYTKIDLLGDESLDNGGGIRMYKISAKTSGISGLRSKVRSLLIKK